MPQALSRSLERNIQWLRKRLNLDENGDIVQRCFVALGQTCCLLYIEGLCSSQLLSEHVLRPLLRCKETMAGKEALDFLVNKLLETPSVRACEDLEQIIKDLMSGHCVLLMDTLPVCLLMDLRSPAHRPLSTPISESVVDGPHEAFNESLRDNLTLLHRKIKSPLLICKHLTVGKLIPVQVSLCYMDGICKQETLEALQRRLDGIDVDIVQSSGMLEQLIEDSPNAMLPQVVGSERPDRMVSFLLEGQAVLLLEGSPRAIALPTGFWHIFHASDDTSSRWQQGSFMRLIRIIGIFCTVLFPALFVTIVIYHPSALPMTLLTSIIESRTIMPISLFGEALLMQVIFNLINEANVRVPGMMGSSLGLVSALILGSAAVQASLISPLLIIIVALSGLGNYSFPNYATGFSFRMMQLILLVAGWLMGLCGVLFCALLFLCRIAGMTSLGYPYLAPQSPHREHNPDLLLRKPIFRQQLRSYFANPATAQRTHGRMRGFFPEKER